MSAELLQRLSRSRELGRITSGGVVFDCGLPGCDGAPFELFREPHHRDEDIHRAEMELRRGHEVSFLFVTEMPAFPRSAPTSAGLSPTRIICNRSARFTEFPRGGDAVELAREWLQARGVINRGDYGFVEGCLGLEYLGGVPITFNTIPFVGNGYCCGSGGPGTIKTPISQLTPTTRRKKFRCWCWKDNQARRHNAMEYLRTCRVWEWYPE